MYEYCNLGSRVSGFKSKPCTSHCSSKPHNLPVNVIGWTLHHSLHNVSGKESHKGPIQLWKCPKNKRYLPAIGEKITDSSNSIPSQLTNEKPFLLLLHVQLEPVPVRIATHVFENQTDFIIYLLVTGWSRRAQFLGLASVSAFMGTRHSVLSWEAKCWLWRDIFL